MTKFKINNKSFCTRCKDTIESLHQHDYVKCSCGGACVDGGPFAEIMSVSSEGWGINVSIYSDDDFVDIRAALMRNGTTLLKDMSNDWLEECISYERLYRPKNRFLKYYIKELEYREENSIFVK